ncbi:MAG: sigma-70 family RNA polymerase sigma factor [Acidobacteria bacterium]|nr:sigma-70 family RNA polymerase sigma factor [Acidobacteriota bacterium]
MNSAKSSQPNNTETADTVAHLFRHQAGRMTAALSRVFGLEHLELIEDAIQDAMVKALKLWPFRGIPDNPEAWLIRVARNEVIDNLRRDKRTEPLTDIEPESNDAIEVRFADELDEDVLRMMFACCSPRISGDSQVALTLRAIGGFNVREIAAAFLAQDEAIAKLLTRAKQKLRDSELEFPPPAEITERLEPVLKVLYLMFNEGYSTSNGESPVRNDLCFEAIRLAKLLAGHRLTGIPKVHAMLALFMFQTARIGARFDENGDILRLSEQDRGRWDKRMIADGLRHLRSSATGNELSEYHIEAEIASIHSLASDFESTDWKRLIGCYDRLAEYRPSPVVALNRAIARAKVFGYESSLRELEDLRVQLAEYPLFNIALADLKSEAGQIADARESYNRALQLTGNASMYRFLRRKIDES